MGISEFIESAKRLLVTLNRPDWKTFSLSLKITFLGVGLIGGIGYIIRLMATTLQAL
jgi:protein translocase SEC61 complex gamma subunit